MKHNGKTNCLNTFLGFTLIRLVLNVLNCLRFKHKIGHSATIFCISKFCMLQVLKNSYGGGKMKGCLSVNTTRLFYTYIREPEALMLRIGRQCFLECINDMHRTRVGHFLFLANLSENRKASKMRYV